ncbi:MAG: NUDIX hydrolase [Candidatus Berkelbacteria bacterium]
MRKINREIVSAVIISKDNKIYFAKYTRPGGVYADCWHIPGGGIEEGEDQITALKREITEETGINITNAKIKFIDGEEFGDSEKTLRDTGETVLCHMHFNDYQINIDLDADKIEMNPTDDEFSEQKWVNFDDIKNLNITPPSINLFKKMGILKD